MKDLGTFVTSECCWLVLAFCSSSALNMQTDDVALAELLQWFATHLCLGMEWSCTSPVAEVRRKGSPSRQSCRRNLGGVDF